MDSDLVRMDCCLNREIYQTSHTYKIGTEEGILIGAGRNPGILINVIDAGSVLNQL